MRLFHFILLGGFLLIATGSSATNYQTDSTETSKLLSKWLDGSYLYSQIFLGYQYHLSTDNGLNEFVIKRGYINFSKDITPFLSGRITPDITIDREGDGEGDVEMRLKYCYIQFKAPSWKFLTEPSFFIGQVFTPWIEFEEKINRYRVEGSHFLDRVKQTPSADFGIAFTALLGGKLSDDFQKRINNKRYAGRFGSLAIGLYNGGGYHAIEKNNNKTFQWRLSIRPLPNLLTGFQVSGTGTIGKGNIPESPKWIFNSAVLSYEHEWFVITGQYYKAIGNFDGSLIDNITYEPLKNYGTSYFGEVKLLNKKISIIGRLDMQTVNKGNEFLESTRYIAGIAYHLSGRNKLIFDYNMLNVSSNNAKPEERILEILFELAF
jgi:hypothetical protein